MFPIWVFAEASLFPEPPFLWPSKSYVPSLLLPMPLSILPRSLPWSHLYVCYRVFSLSLPTVPLCSRRRVRHPFRGCSAARGDAVAGRLIDFVGDSAAAAATESAAMDSSQEGAFNGRKAALSLNLKNNDGLAKLCEQKSPLAQVLASSMDIAAAQKQYAQGFFDALRSVHNLNNFEFDTKKDGLFSPGYIVPALVGELASPFATTPTSSRELQAILQAMVGTPLGGTQPPTSTAVAGFPSPFSSILPGPSNSSLAPSTSTSTSSAATEKETKTIEVKQEPMNVSEDSPDTTSDHSRSSSVALSLSSSHRTPKVEFEMSLDDQERRKLERKRARNRAAASKCRQKKMDRINELEIQIQQEKMRSQALDNDLNRLKSALQQLQHLVERHTRGSCVSQC